MRSGSAHRTGVAGALAWVFALLALAAGASFIGWAQAGGSDLRLLSSLEPGRTRLLLAAALDGRELFRHMNFPLGSILLTLAWTAGVTAVGHAVLRVIGAPAMNAAERWGFAFAAGFLLTGILLLVAGLAGGATTPVMAGFLVALLCAAGTGWRVLLADVRALPPPVRLPAGRHALRNAVVLSVLALAGLAALAALTPPIQSDGMRYHLGAPQEYLKAGRIVYLPGNAFSNFPFLPEMHFMLALGLRAPVAAHLMHLVCMVAAACGLCGAVMRFVEPLVPGAPRWLTRTPSMLVVAGIPASLIVATWPFIDHAVALFFLLALHAMMRAFASGSRGDHVLAGLMAGGALGCKYTAVAWLGALVLLAAWNYTVWAPAPASGGRRAFDPRAVVVAALVACALGAPWFIKNAVLTGNPVYPLANSLFDAGEWTPESAAFLAGRMGDKGDPATAGNLLPTLVRVSYNWVRYEGQYMGPLWLVLLVAGLGGSLVLMLHVATRARPVLLFLAAAGASYLMWYFTYRSNRMLVPTAMLLVPPASALLAVAWCRARAAAVVGFAALAVSGLFGAAWSAQYNLARATPPTTPHLLGAVSDEEYSARALSYWQAFDYLNRHAGPAERVLLVGEHRIYGAQFRALWSDWFDTPMFATLARRHGWRTADDFFAFARRNELRWILHNTAELALQQEFWRARFTADEWRLLNEVLASPLLKPTVLPPGVTVYHVEPAP